MSVTQIHRVKEIVDSVFAHSSSGVSGEGGVRSSSGVLSEGSAHSSNEVFAGDVLSSNEVLTEGSALSGDTAFPKSNTSPSKKRPEHDMPPLNLPKVRKDPSVEIIPISLGCNGACTFCQTKLARGSLRSYPVKEILQRVDAVKNTASEIWLTSEDTGAYGQDIGADLITLLQSIQERVQDSNTMIKIGMTNPPYLKPILPQLASVLASPHFFSYLHIPVQVGVCRAVDT